MTGQHSKGSTGTLIIIGGHEDRDPDTDRVILHEVAERLQGGKLVLATIASHSPEGYFEQYQAALADLHEGELAELYVDSRQDADTADKLKLLDDAAGVFFSGGDQLRITSQIGRTELERRIRGVFERGGLIAGTSAGASAMSDTMLVKGTSRETHRIGGLHMAPGLGLLPGVVIDQHFAERGRFGRLLGAVAHNPRVLGMGIDEDTAAVVEGERLTVIGSGAVYIFDGGQVSYSNVAEAQSDHTLSMHDVRVHVLGAGETFDLSTRRPRSSGG